MKLGKKIKTYRENGGLTQIELSNLTGISRSSIQLYEADKVEIPVKNLEKIAKALKLDTDIFLKNLSISMSISPVNKSSISRQLVQNNAKNSNLSFTDENSLYIRTINSRVGAGESVEIDGISVIDSGECVAFSTLLFKTPPKLENLRAMQVSGYSMIPMLYPDSWVIVEISPVFDGDGLYVIDFGGAFMVKMVQKSPNGALDIISINKEYQSYHIGADDQSEIRIVAKVLRCVI